MVTLAALVFIVLIYTIAVLYFRSHDPEIHWEWDKINTNDLNFPDGFLWGAATSAHQVDGDCTNNNWHAWEQGSFPDGCPHILNGDVSGAAADHWNLFEEDLQRLTELGLQAYRFSLEWSKIEPRRGHFDRKAINHYHDLLTALEKAGIEPMVTLYHFTHPLWFDEMGAFEREENIGYFKVFCEKMFAEFNDRVHYWCTINEVEVLATESYFLGKWPPGANNSQRTVEVMKNLLLAHVVVYRALKDQPRGNRARIGLVKNIHQFDPRRSWHLGDNLVGWVLDRIFNQAILEFLKSGRFRLNIPGLANINYFNSAAPGANDFIGLNYYSHLVVNFRLNREQPFDFSLRTDETPTDMEYTIYPEGLYRAICQISTLQLPIYITENGIADARDDRREVYIRRYIYAMSRAIRAGAYLRGYFYWSLLDNFEWAEGYSMKFGLYAVDFKTQARRLRKGAEALRDIVKRSTA